MDLNSSQMKSSVANCEMDAEERFRGLFEAAPDAMVITRSGGEMELVNSRTELMFGYQREELLGMPLETLVPGVLGEHHAALRDHYESGPKNQRDGADRTLRARRKDGGEFPVEISISPLQTQEGLLVISSIRDVTERSKTESTILQLNSELEDCVRRRTNAYRAANEKLRSEIAGRRRLEKQILYISEQEQQRIGQDLHDDLGQRLAGISYMAQVLSRNLEKAASPDAEQAKRITGLLEQALTLTRLLARGLHPVALKTGGLHAALADLAERTSEMFGVNCHYTGSMERPVLNELTATHLYRIAQEAVTNALNHGKATDVEITLCSHLDHAILSVRDNGIGLPENGQNASGMGLRIMNYRADVIGAFLKVSSSSTGSGTTLLCSVSCSCDSPPNQ